MDFPSYVKPEKAVLASLHQLTTIVAAANQKTNIIGTNHSWRMHVLWPMGLESVDADRRLDVRDVEGAPFDDIMAALDELSSDESLLLVNSFEPEPLYDVLEQRGFTYEVSNPEQELWHVKVEHA